MVKLPQGYEIHEVPSDYKGKLWIEGQLRQFEEAIRNEKDSNIILLNELLLVIEESIRNGDCPVPIEIAFADYQNRRD